MKTVSTSGRRNFLKKSAAILALSSLGNLSAGFIGNKQPLRVAVIGTGWYGKSDLFRLLQIASCEVVALCDVDRIQLEEAATLLAQRQSQSNPPQLYKDYRELFKNHALDITIIGTPDHWHALQTIAALEAGSHVYVQKPVSVDVLEGEAVVAAAKKYAKVVQVGLQRRSTPHLIEAKQAIIDTDKLGKIAAADIFCYYHMREDKTKELQEIPAHFDYDFWTGPAPLRPFTGLPHGLHWRSFMEYGNGITGDMAVHMLDAVRWMLNLDWPHTIAAKGGIFVQNKGQSNTADTQTAIFEFDNVTVTWQHRTWGNPVDPEYPWGFKIYGEHGVLAGSPFKAEFTPYPDAESQVFECLYEREKYPEDLTETGMEIHAAPATRRHFQNMVESISHNTDPIADIYSSHISTASCILANLSMDLGRPLRYDPKRRIILNDPEATELLERPYRIPWIHPGKQWL
ncbi:MAG: Gfo/Idh/MocA family protein [Mongoliitalea sp.]